MTQGSHTECSQPRKDKMVATNRVVHSLYSSQAVMRSGGSAPLRVAPHRAARRAVATAVGGRVALVAARPESRAGVLADATRVGKAAAGEAGRVWGASEAVEAGPPPVPEWMAAARLRS